MEENYYAFLICILKPVTVEQSFDMMDGKVAQTKNLAITSEDIEDMILMKQQGMTNQKIGELYGISEEATCKRIKRYERKRSVSG